MIFSRQACLTKPSGMTQRWRPLKWWEIALDQFQSEAARFSEDKDSAQYRHRSFGFGFSNILFYFKKYQ